MRTKHVFRLASVSFYIRSRSICVALNFGLLFGENCALVEIKPSITPKGIILKSWKFPFPLLDQSEVNYSNFCSESLKKIVRKFQLSGHLQQLKSEQWKIRVILIDDKAKKY